MLLVSFSQRCPRIFGLHHIFLLLGVINATVGCDAARKGTQKNRIEVSSASSGLPVAAAKVICAPTKRQGPSTLYELSVEECGRQSSTDENGNADFTVSVFTLRGGIPVWFGLDPIKLVDKVTNRNYLFRLDGRETEILSVHMAVGAITSGEHFVLTVRDIAQPISE